MKKNLLYILTLVVLALTSCESPEYVAPTVQRQALTSISAIFTSGPFTDQEMAKLDIPEGEIPARLVIPVPYFYPVTSDNETTEYMTNVRIKAEMATGCSIEPSLTVLDLTKENAFVFTDAQGKKTSIVITGERVKSNACELTAFNITSPVELSGVIDKSSKKVSVISAEDLSQAFATAEVSAHATISPDPAEAHNYNEPMVFTVTAHDGVTMAEYTVVKEVPEKIDFGFDKNSVEQLFNMDPVSNLGMPAYNVLVGPTIAALKGKVVICAGDGSTPIYINGISGAKQGEIKLGAAVAGSITNDEAEHLLIVNKANGGETLNIFRSNGVEDTPVLFHSFANPSSYPCGSKIKAIGNIDGDAIITITNEGIDGVASTGEFIMVIVRGGVVADVVAQDVSATGYAWGSAPVNFTTVVPRTVNPADGIFLSYYGPSQLSHIAPDGTVSGQFNSDTTGWGLNPNCLDSKAFNNCNYLALFVVSHFPAWGMGPQLYLYNVTDMGKFTGSDVTDIACLELTNQGIDWYQLGDFSVASGDVVIAPSADGYKIYIYYYDHNSQVIGGYVADCIKR
ncbi:MAG: DUF5018 domain-containing protein [Muribaculaceae bacterium]